MGIVTAARVTADSTFFADLFGPIFGPRGAITEGSPSVPPVHGRSYSPEMSSNPLGNRWIKYQLDHPQHLKRIDFRTPGDAAGTEILLTETEK
jgi:hypothetical protein